MDDIVDPPPALSSPPSIVKQVKGVWVEIQYPPGDKRFVRYGSAGPQYLIRIHKDDKIQEYLRYMYDDTASSQVRYELDRMFESFDLRTRKERLEVWKGRVEFKDGVQLYPKDFKL
jgi:hypothetical protein